ncbi:MAG: hypothetical protein BAJALOKI2v1_710008 [Promethearchaeota archaeon]|nr:MAG: hypothetical protein BAJALOKI2v1_710008 [Candidatus Lokiarchaeota archaeon]
MDKEIDLDLINLLNAFSNKIAYKILYLYHLFPNGFNLTDTSKELDEKTSTVNDHLEKLLDARLIYKEHKEYKLSIFGNYVLNSINKFETLNKLKEILGKLPAQKIPLNFIDDLIPHIDKVEIQTNQWKFMRISNILINQIQSEMKETPVELKILGWKSLSLSLDIIKTYFNNLTLAPQSLQGFFDKTNFELISDKKIIDDIKTNDRIMEILRTTDLKERIMICKNVEKFDFTLLRYKDLIHFFLNEEKKEGINYSVFFKNNSGALDFFNKVYAYYLHDSVSLQSSMDS